MMPTRTALLACVGFALAGLAAAGLMYDQLPEQVPTHWGLNGEPDDWTPRALAIWLGPATSLGVPLLVAAILQLGPRKEHLERSEDAIAVILGALGAFGFAIQLLTLRAATRPDQQLAGSAIIGLVGLLFVVLGLVIPRVRSNGYVGFRTPWALESEANWHQTQRVGGWGMLLTGLAMMLSAAALPPAGQLAVTLGGTFGLVVVLPIGWSWWIAQREAAEGT